MLSSQQQMALLTDQWCHFCQPLKSLIRLSSKKSKTLAALDYRANVVNPKFCTIKCSFHPDSSKHAPDTKRTTTLDIYCQFDTSYSHLRRES